jgi:hypothetical protein
MLLEFLKFKLNVVDVGAVTVLWLAVPIPVPITIPFPTHVGGAENAPDTKLIT